MSGGSAMSWVSEWLAVAQGLRVDAAAGERVAHHIRHDADLLGRVTQAITPEALFEVASGQFDRLIAE